jgi:iduronate 2-sulfatase
MPVGGQGFAHVIIDGDGAEQADYQAASEAIRLLEEKRDKPLFLAVGLVRPHVPVHAPRKYFDLYPLESIELRKVAPGDRDDIPEMAFMRPQPDWGMSPQQQKEAMRAYYASTSFMDAQAGRVIDAVERLGQTDNTIFVFFGDHGYALGEHQAWQKMMLFEPVARVPLIIAAPGTKARGAGSKALVELIDVFPTLAELCGMPVPKNVEGVSLRPLLDDPTKSVKDAAFTQVQGGRGQGVYREGRSIRTDRWRYTEWNASSSSEPARELYDHEDDPNEWTNLASDPKHGETVKTLSAQLNATVPVPAREPTTEPGATRPARRQQR